MNTLLNSAPDLSRPNSLWEVTAETAQSFSALADDIETDTLIVGAGYTGLSTALHLENNAGDVVVIDQAQPGWGCSGRNGGQVNPNWKTPLDRLEKLYSKEDLKLFIETINESADLVFELIDQHDIKCQARRNGCLISCKGDKAKAYLSTWVNNWQAMQAEVELMDSQTTADVIGTDFYEHCLLDHRGGSLQPLSYVRGLARACSEQGTTIFGDTPALSISQAPNGWKVSSANGDIQCRKLILATNGYTDDLWPGLSRCLIPVASMLSATEPLPADIAGEILPGRQPVAEYMGVPFYYRIDESDRMVFGGRGTISGGIGGLNTQHLKARAAALFPALKSVRWEYDWAGYVGITAHQQPMLMRLGENAYAGLGFNGRGITMATMMGKQLAKVVVGEAPDLPVRHSEQIPFHRFHRLGVAMRILSGYVADRFC